MSLVRRIHVASTAAVVVFMAGMSVSQLAMAQSSAKQRSKISPIIEPEKSLVSGTVFIENIGQFDPKVRFQVKIGSQTAWLTSVGIVFDATRQTRAGIVAAADPEPRGSTSPSIAQTLGSRTLDRLVFTEDFVGANCCSKVEGIRPQPGIYNYFQGSDPAQWRTNVRGYSEVVYRDVWPGIDLRIYGNRSDLEQELIVRPGGDLSNAQISYRGIDQLGVAKDGSLEVATAFGILRETKPRIYQELAGGKRITVDGVYKLLSKSAYTFEAGPHDPLYALVVDPTLLYSTFIGGSAGNLVDNYTNEYATGVAVDPSGSAYVAGYTASTDFPTTVGAFQVSPPSGSFITKLNATGSALIYSTYLGDISRISAIAVDASGNAYVTGVAFSGLPVTPNAYWPTNSQACGSDFFMTELNPTGSGLIYSTCFNDGSDYGGALYGNYPHAIAVDSKGRAFITGSVFQGAIPTTSNAFQPSYGHYSGCNCASSAFVMVFDTTASGTSSLVYSTYFGVTTTTSNYYGSSGNGIAVDAYGKIYITGWAGPNLPISTGAFQMTTGGGSCNPAGGLQLPCPDAFVAKLDPSASGPQGLLYSTYLGGPNFDSGNAIAVDAAGNAYVTGNAGSSSFPVTAGAFQTTGFGGQAFVTSLNAGGSQLVYSTFLGGNSGSSGNGLAVDSLGNAYVAGNFRAGGPANPFFPVTPDAFQSSFTKTSGDSQEAFLAKLNPAGSGLVYSSYLGGIGDDVATAVAVDQTGDAYVAGHTGSVNFPISASAFQPAVRGTGDAFVTKFPLGTSQTLSISSIAPTTGGNVGTVSPQIFGTGFHAGATANLNCSPRIAGTNLSVGPEGRFLNTTFDLTSASTGSCDVVVTNPDGTSVTLSQAFTVKQGGATNIQIYLTGAEARRVPPEVGMGPADVLLDVTVSNTGNVDAAGGFVYLPLNSGFTLTSTSPDASSASATTLAATPLSNSSAMLTIPPSGISYLQNLPVHQSRVVSSTATNPLSSAVCSALWGPVCFTQNMVKVVDCIVAKDASAGLTCATASVVCGAAAACLLAGGAVCSRLIQQCISQSLAPASTGGSGCLTNPVVQACIVNNSSSCTSSVLPCVVPADPNNLVGPLGVGGQHWIAGARALSYAIFFNNEPTATAPAQQVVVTQPLGANVNLSTLTLPAITVPNSGTAVPVPIPAGAFNPAANVNEFITNVDLRPAQSLLVNVDAKLDPATQTLTWTFTSIDPTTGLPPLNPLIGFLPPGAGANVSFSVTPTPGLATGAQVAEQAVIVFQGSSPMSTPTWTNTIDNTPPVSYVSPLAATSTCPAFRVSWSGSDVGSGLQGFTIYVSDLGGPFTAWLSKTTTTAAIYQGAVGHSYSFYSVATDLTGNMEGAKISAEASTTVTAASSCGPPSLSGQVLSSLRSGATVTVNLQLTNTGFTAAQAVNINQITFRTLSGSGTVTLAGPVLPAAEGPLGIGASTTVPLTLNVPATVTRFSLTEGGTLLDGAGHTYNYSLAQTVIP